ncbi:Delta(24)-sterol C-methyltransferase [Brettanomyces nanus]|uniref:Sterol 24-C-methyltransferase n=1 Tax=Eeniella nana TaxID=13502 RepID=A0A875S6K1_EENNA|nr:Delta(24)-sterol C-methyltransferase [Brettanomyces nanus]QPG74814.1 Delta(24)-sterol C-methyltransferase [Brettanomyces nanus]
MSSVKLAPKEFKKDKDFAHALHGKTATESTGLGALAHKNKEAEQAALDGYFKHWDGKTDKDSEQSRLDDYSSLTKQYYNLVTDFYEYGWGSSFHFSTFYKGEPFHQAIARHEHYLALKMGLKEGMKVLDVGCGVGGPAREICRFTGASIVGLNNNDYQVERGQHYAHVAGLDDKLKFVKGDFMQMDFEPESFDAVYSIEATVHAPAFEGVYGEIYKVLKPGGVFAVYEWVMTDKYDEKNPEHRKIAYGIEIGDGIPKMYKREVAEKALKTVGFEITYQHDLADDYHEVPWYYPLSGDWKYIKSLRDAITFFRTSYLGRKLTTTFVNTLEAVGIAPKGSSKVTDALEEAAVYLVEGGKQKLFTPMMLFVCKKPEN